jgi:WD40 repeat protein
MTAPAVPSLSSAAAVQLGDYVTSLAWRPDGQMLAAACADGHVHELLPSGDGSAPAGTHEGGACVVAYGADGTLASAGEDGRVAIGPRPPQPAGAGWVELLAWSPDGGLLASAVGRRVQLWTADGELVGESAAMPATVECLAWSPEARVLAAGGNGGVRLLGRDASEAEPALEFAGVVLALAFSPESRRLACGLQDLAVWTWDLGGRLATTMDGYARKVRELGWSPDGRRLATGGGTVPVVWELGDGISASGQVELRGGHEKAVTWCGFQPRGSLLATAGEDGLAILWSLPADRPLTAATIGEAVSACAWSPDGTRLAMGGETGRVAVFTLT